MKSSKSLLFPFSTDSPYFEGYSWSVSLAVKMGASLRLLAAAPGSGTSADQHNTIFCSLLEAQGYYLEHYHQHTWPRPDIRRQSLTDVSDLGHELLTCLASEPADIVIVDHSFKEKYGKTLKKLMKGPGGLIILSSKPTHFQVLPSRPDHFYQQLKESEFYNLPPQFYTDLSKDNSMHNYLRSLFQLRNG
jgi:hypothetical protein